MKLFTCLLFAGILLECITVMTASPLDKKFLTKSKATGKSSTQRSKREPGVALVLSIIDKNSPKIQKLEIGMDDEGYNIKDRNSKITSAVGKRLISKLLEKGDVKIKPEFDKDAAKKHKWEELIEMLKDATECKHRKDDDEDTDSFKPQKIKRKPNSRDSDDNKLDTILELLRNLINKDKIPQTTQTDSGESEMPPSVVNLQPQGDEDSRIQLSNEEPNGSEELSVELIENSHENDEYCEDCEENSNNVKRKPKPEHLEGSNEESAELADQIKRRPKPQQLERNDDEDENDTQGSAKRKPKPEHISGREDSDEEPEEPKEPIHRRPKPQQRERNLDEDEQDTQGSSKRKPKPEHIVDSENSDEEPEESKEPIHRRPKPQQREQNDDEDVKDTQGSVKRKPKPEHIYDSDEESEEQQQPINRRPKPQQRGRDDEEDVKDTQGSVERKPKPEHISDREDSDEEPEEQKEPIHRRPKPQHRERNDDGDDKDTQGSVKRKPKPEHTVEKEDSDEEPEEPKEPIHRRPKPQQREQNDDENDKDTVKRKPKPSHVESENSEDCEDCEENINDVKRKTKPEHKKEENNDDDEEIESLQTSSDLGGISNEPDSESSEDDSNEEEGAQCGDDLDEEQLLQGIAFVQNQLKRFLGIECTCNPTENTVLKECPLHKKSSARRRRADQKERILKVRSSEENDKKFLKNKKFAKKASVKDLKKYKQQTKKINKKTDSSTANIIKKTRVHTMPKNFSETSEGDIVKLLKQLGLSADIVPKSSSKISNSEKKVPSKKPVANNDDLQFFRNESGVHRSSPNSKSTGKKNRRKLRNRRKGRKNSSTSTPKRIQRGIASEEITAKQEKAASLHNYKTEVNTKEILLPRPVDRSTEHFVDPDIEGLKNLFDEYKKRVAAIKQNENSDEKFMVKSDDDATHTSKSQDSPAEETETELTESLENILKEIGASDGIDYTGTDADDSNSAKEYVIAHESDSNYRNLYNKFTNMFSTGRETNGE